MTLAYRKLSYFDISVLNHFKID